MSQTQSTLAQNPLDPFAPMSEDRRLDQGLATGLSRPRGYGAGVCQCADQA